MQWAVAVAGRQATHRVTMYRDASVTTDYQSDTSRFPTKPTYQSCTVELQINTGHLPGPRRDELRHFTSDVFDYLLL